MFDLLQKDGLDGCARERVKLASKELLALIKAGLDQLDRFWEKEQTKADIEVFILDKIFTKLPTPPFSVKEKEQVAKSVYVHVWRQAVRRDFSAATIH